jgi:hypothetical protein
MQYCGMKTCKKCLTNQPDENFYPGRGACKGCISSEGKSRYAAKPRVFKIKTKIPLTRAEISKRFRNKHPEKAKAVASICHARWLQENPEKARASRTATARKRRENNPALRMRNSFSGGIFKSLRDGKGHRSCFELVGYTLEDLKQRLEAQFTSGMNWTNYGRGPGKWVIDHHPRPQCSFHFTSYNDTQFKECWALLNLRPLDWMENSKKAEQDRLQSIRNRSRVELELVEKST